ncbi:MAG: hypothetical protein FJW31_14700 [Acidobacteria bacterium]|nr:hypothetical protein [Acidobacteriota bacterium]
MPSRRDLLAGAAALPVLSEAQTAYTPRVFTSAELDLIRDLAELTRFRPALAAAAATKAPAKDVITRLHPAEDPFFKQLKDLTVDAYDASREGLAQEFGWHGYTALAEFKGCTHKEHQGD